MTKDLLHSIDFGVDDLFNTNQPKKPFNPKDPYGMNNLAVELNQDLTKTANDIKKDIEGVKEDIKSFKKELVDPITNYIKERQVLKWLKNIRIFGDNIRTIQHATR